MLHVLKHITIINFALTLEDVCFFKVCSPKPAAMPARGVETEFGRELGLEVGREVASLDEVGRGTLEKRGISVANIMGSALLLETALDEEVWLGARLV